MKRPGRSKHSPSRASNSQDATTGFSPLPSNAQISINLHAPKAGQSQSIAPIHLDPQFDALLDTLSDEVAKLSPVPTRSQKREQAQTTHESPLENLVWMESLGSSATMGVRSELKWGIRTASAVLGLGVIGTIASIPELGLDFGPFALPQLIISLFCCLLGSSCLSIGLIARRIQLRRAASYDLYRKRQLLGDIRGWLPWLETTCSLIGLSILAWVGYDYVVSSAATPDYAWMIRRGLAGLVFASLSMQLQFVRMLRSSFLD